MMAKNGFTIRGNVKVSVDPSLPFMGYTMSQGQSFNIVVSGGAVGSGMLEGLLVHEMSHIYRIQSRHPSHNAGILEEAVGQLQEKNRHYDYQQKILHDLLNDIQDLYADDIAFRVFRSSPANETLDLTDFLQSWVKDEPVKSGNSVQDRWINASITVHNARAIAQMERHKVADTGGKAEAANKRFLGKVSPEYAKDFEFFRNRLTSLDDKMTEDEYRTFLAEHLNRFVKLVGNAK